MTGSHHGAQSPLADWHCSGRPRSCLSCTRTVFFSQHQGLCLKFPNRPLGLKDGTHGVSGLSPGETGLVRPLTSMVVPAPSAHPSMEAAAGTTYATKVGGSGTPALGWLPALGATGGDG